MEWPKAVLWSIQSTDVHHLSKRHGVPFLILSMYIGLKGAPTNIQYIIRHLKILTHSCWTTPHETVQALIICHMVGKSFYQYFQYQSVLTSVPTMGLTLPCSFTSRSTPSHNTFLPACSLCFYSHCSHPQQIDYTCNKCQSGLI